MLQWLKSRLSRESDQVNAALAMQEANIYNARAQRTADITNWMTMRAFKPVMGLFGGYAKDFDSHREYQFMRTDWDGPMVFKLADAHPAFNISGLHYRPIDD